MTRPLHQSLGLRSARGLVFWDGDVVPARPQARLALRGTRLDVAQFEDWLHERLVDFRVAEHVYAAMGEKSAVIRFLDAAAHRVEEAVADGRLRRLPVFYAEPAVWYAAHKLGHEWAALLARRDLGVIERVLRDAAAALRRQRERRGRRKQLHLDDLLRAVADRLHDGGLPSRLARERARDLLSQLGVKFPRGDLADQRAVRRARGSISGRT